jgi:hypothetical protein
LPIGESGRIFRLSWHCPLRGLMGSTEVSFLGTHGFPATRSQKGSHDRSIPSIRAVSWQHQLNPRTKIEHFSLNSRPFEGAFSGIDRVSHCPRAGFFSEFFQTFFRPLSGRHYKTTKRMKDK